MPKPPRPDPGAVLGRTEPAPMIVNPGGSAKVAARPVTALHPRPGVIRLAPHAPGHRAIVEGHADAIRGRMRANAARQRALDSGSDADHAEAVRAGRRAGALGQMAARRQKAIEAARRPKPSPAATRAQAAAHRAGKGTPADRAAALAAKAMARGRAHLIAAQRAKSEAEVRRLSRRSDRAYDKAQTLANLGAPRGGGEGAMRRHHYDSFAGRR